MRRWAEAAQESPELDAVQGATVARGLRRTGNGEEALPLVERHSGALPYPVELRLAHADALCALGRHEAAQDERRT